MGILICQTCETIVGHTNDEKVSKLYTKSNKCESCNKK
ncbi:GapA-binding peptide SR1P [Bacillus taeanensis]|uniref:GapA-binding peptide SR1P n=1 Tax=Bacillus taeanensis TaxID=273032 RepID=A0A366XV57_9BACI|nr:GapA-binding peptide SR1P [Bacillus taeanensis]RBW69536.1 GapA-binding peptide SR1P [Bacillus taeanensis]